MGPPAWGFDGPGGLVDVIPDVASSFQLSPHKDGSLAEHAVYEPFLHGSAIWPLLENIDPPSLPATGSIGGNQAASDIVDETTPPPAAEAVELPRKDTPTVVNDADDSDETFPDSKQRLDRIFSVELPRSTLINPRSCFDGFVPPLPPTKERDALAVLLEVAKPKDGGFVEIELDSFCFYIDTKAYPVEMRPLHHMRTKYGSDQFYMDGILRVGENRHYVQRVPIAELPIGNYGSENHTTRGQIWVRSAYNQHREVYYRLNKPSIEYERFHHPFLWIADLAKHVVDYSAAMIEQGRQVDIHCFKSHFESWIHRVCELAPRVSTSGLPDRCLGQPRVHLEGDERRAGPTNSQQVDAVSRDNVLHKVQADHVPAASDDHTGGRANGPDHCDALHQGMLWAYGHWKDVEGCWRLEGS
jgi:hypothetical protein